MTESTSRFLAARGADAVSLCIRCTHRESSFCARPPSYIIHPKSETMSISVRLKWALLGLQTDPEAAKIVFECGAPVVMLPVELTHTALVTPDVLNRISAELVGNTPFLHLVKQLLLYFAESYKTVFKFDNPPLHDPCAVAYVIAPEMFQVRLNIAASALCCCCLLL